jgi:hypothetical protein
MRGGPLAARDIREWNDCREHGFNKQQKQPRTGVPSLSSQAGAGTRS